MRLYSRSLQKLYMKKHIYTLFIFICCTSKIFSQEINGILLDKQSGEPLIGATIAVKGTANGTAADVDGKFQLKITEKPPFTLLFSYIGYTNYRLWAGHLFVNIFYVP